MNNNTNFGIEAMEIYFPKTFVDQSQLEIYDNIPQGKYTKGLGQLQLSFTYSFEDINSISLTVVSNLLKNYDINPNSVGRIQVGTQTLIDKSKSTKTILMDLFKQNHDIQGVTSLNACYGATNALINALNWLQSQSWDGRYAIVVAADIAVYEKGSARSTGGAGGVAMLLGPNGKISIDKTRASYFTNKYDFYKPNPFSEYPIVAGKQSIQCYINSAEKCCESMKQKLKDDKYLRKIDFFCFHCPFYKIVYKSFCKLMAKETSSQIQLNEKFNSMVHPCLYLNQKIGNIYTGSVYMSLISLLISNQKFLNKKICLFSYGSGLCSTMLTLNIHENPISKDQIKNIYQKLNSRIKINPEQYGQVMKKREESYGKLFGKVFVHFDKIDAGVYYLSELDYNWKRKYQIKSSNISMDKKQITQTVQRLQHIKNTLVIVPKTKKFYEQSVEDRRLILEHKYKIKIDDKDLEIGGLTMTIADTMIQNVIGKLSLPLSIVPLFVINEKQYMIPMSIQQPSVIAACSSIGKFLSNYSFYTSSTLNIMIGQVYLPKVQVNQVHKILSMKKLLIQQLNKQCENMILRGGGVSDFKIRSLNQINSKEYVMDIYINVCQAMGANIVNTLTEHAKKFIQALGIHTGIAILSNYCTQRKSVSWFEIPVQDMGWKNCTGQIVVEKILQAQKFARSDHYRAVTHNKGIMNGIDAVCMATGQDWRAVQASAHCYACKTGKYMPLSNYEIVIRNQIHYFRGELQLPIAIGTKGGAINKNPLYKKLLNLMGNPTARQLSQIIVSVGLAQNFAALRALAIQGIQKGHMGLHMRALALQNGVPEHLMKQAIQFLNIHKEYNKQAIQKFLLSQQRPKL